MSRQRKRKRRERQAFLKRKQWYEVQYANLTRMLNRVGLRFRVEPEQRAMLRLQIDLLLRAMKQHDRRVLAWMDPTKE